MQLVRIGRKELLAKASGYLERARVIAPERVDVRERTLMVALVTGQREQARQSALFLFRKRKDMDDPFGAEQVLQAYLKVFPDSFEILEELWKLYGEIGEKERGVAWMLEMVSAAETEGALDRAERLLRRLLELDRGNAEAQERLLGIHERQGRQEKVAQESLKLAAALLEQGKREGALALFGKVVEAAGQDGSILEQVAEAYAELGEKTSAYQIYFRLGTVDSEDPDERSRALGYLEKARALRPSHEEPYHQMAQILLAAGDRERAASLYSDLCRLAQEEKDQRKLRKALDKLLEIAPEDNEAAKKQVSLLFSLGETEEGMQVLRRRLAVARSKGDWCSVRELLIDAVDLRPEDMELWQALLEAHNDKEAHTEAETLVTRRATLFRLEGNPERTVELATMAVRAGVESVRLRELLAAAREDVGDLQGALTEYRDLAACLRKEGALDQAFATLERCLTLAEDRRPVLEELVSLAEDHGRSDRVTRWENRLISYLSETGRTDDLLAWLQSNVERHPTRLDVSRRLVEETAANCSPEDVGQVVVAHLERVEKAAPEKVGAEMERLLDEYEVPALLEWCVAWAERAGKKEQERDLLIRMAQGAEDAGDLERACVYMERVLKIDPDSAEAWEVQIRLLDSLGKENELETALLSYARLLARGDRVSESFSAYRRALTVADGDQEVLFELVDLLAESANREEAVAECVRWIAGARDSKDVDGILRVYEKARAIEPTNTHLVHELSRFLERVGRSKEAAERYQELGKVYLERELPDRAIECFRRAKYLVPDDPRLMEQLIGLFENEGMVRAAYRELEGLGELYQNNGEERAAQRVREKLAEMRSQLGPIGNESLEEEPEAVPEEMVPLTPVEETLSFDVEEARGLLRSTDAEAEERLAELLSGERTAREISLLAELHEESGRREEAGGLYRRAGRKAAEEGNLDVACRAFSAAMLIHEEDLDLASELGELEAERGNRPAALELFQQVAERAQRKQEFERAADMYRKMLDLGCQNLAVRTGLAWSLAKADREEEACREFIQYGRMLEEKGLPEEAISAYRKAVSLFPQSKEARECLVRLLESSGRTEDAIRERVELAHTLCAVDETETSLEMLQEILARDPGSIRAREGLITVYSAMQRYPDELRERKALAQVYLDKGERRKAIAQYEEMLELGEQDPKIYLVLAEEYRRAGDRLRARELFVALADHYSEREMWSKSVSCLLQVLQMDPNDLEMRRRIAEAYFHDGMRDKAVAEYLRIAQEYMRQDRFDQAIAQYERVREMDPRNVRILGKIADCYSKQQDSIRAVPVFLEMIDVYRERGILGKAIEVAKAALQRFPKESRIHEALAEIYVQRGMSSEALWIYRRLGQMYPDEVRYRGRILRLEQELGLRKPKQPQETVIRPPAKPVEKEPPPPKRTETTRSFSRPAPARHTADSNMQEAERAFRLGKYAKCLDLCRQIIPTCSPVTHLEVLLHTYSLSARCHMKAGEPKEAIRVLMQALSIGGINREQAMELRYLLGNALEADGQREQAAAVYKKVMEVDPEYADIKSKVILTRSSSHAHSKR